MSNESAELVQMGELEEFFFWEVALVYLCLVVLGQRPFKTN